MRILILGLAAAGFRRGPSWRAWLTGAAIVGLAASLGTYGSPLFWARSLSPLASIVGQHATAAVGQDDSQSLPDGVGGVYWLMATALPGFGAFRYPGKLLVMASLGTCGLVGLGWDEVRRAGSRRPCRLAVAGLATTICSLVLLRLPTGRERFTQFLTLHPDLTTTVFGPLRTPGALAQAIVLLGHAAVMMCACLGAFSLGQAIAATGRHRSHGPVDSRSQPGQRASDPHRSAEVVRCQTAGPGTD